MTTTLEPPDIIDDTFNLPSKDIGIPFVIVVAALLTLCVVIGYVKYRKRRQAAALTKRREEIKSVSKRVATSMYCIA